MLYNIYNLVDHDKDFDVVKHACRPVNKILPPLEQNLDVDPTCHAASIYDFCSRSKGTASIKMREIDPLMFAQIVYIPLSLCLL